MVLVKHRIQCVARLGTVLLQWHPGLHQQEHLQLRASGQEGKDMSKERELLKKHMVLE